MQWAFQTNTLGKFESTPLVLNGIMYFTGPNNTAWAVDARTGRQIWAYRRDLPEGIDVCCGRVNRGFAVLGERLFINTLDAHLLALDMKTGAVVWDSVMADYTQGYSATSAPLIVKDKVIVGIAGAEYGIRGFIDAYDAVTGKLAWRFWVVPEPGVKGNETWEGDSWKRGGGSTWVTGSYDPALNLIYWGTGNPGPDLYGHDRDGDNLYTDSVVALDGDTGVLKWHYQFTPHDTHDWDATQVPVLADRVIGGVPRKVLLFANRNGFYYTLDRVNGSLLASRPFVRTTWAEKINPDGRPAVLPNTDPTEKGTEVCPDITGGTNFQSPAYNPKTGLLVRHGARGLRHLLRLGAGVRRRRVLLRRRGSAHRARLQRDAGHRSRDRRREVGVQVPHAVDGRRALHRVRPGVRRRHGRQPHGVRRGERQEPVALPDGLGHLRGADHLPARRPAIPRAGIRHDRLRVGAATSALTRGEGTGA